MTAVFRARSHLAPSHHAMLHDPCHMPPCPFGYIISCRPNTQQDLAPLARPCHQLAQLAWTGSGAGPTHAAPGPHDTGSTDPASCAGFSCRGCGFNTRAIRGLSNGSGDTRRRRPTPGNPGRQLWVHTPCTPTWRQRHSISFRVECQVLENGGACMVRAAFDGRAGGNESRTWGRRAGCDHAESRGRPKDQSPVHLGCRNPSSAPMRAR